MKKLSFFSLFFVLALSLSAQIQHGLKSGLNMEHFPEVSFVWNSPNPEPLDVTHFALFEDNNAVGLDITVLPSEHQGLIPTNILFLWEDMASHYGQSDFTRELLIQFFSMIFNDPSEAYEVAVFNRKTEDRTLKPLVGYFTSDTSVLLKAISSHKNDSRYYYSNQSDLYQAIDEGLEILKNEPVERAGIIVVVTAGLGTKGSVSEMEVRQNALAANIPIYVVNYPIFGNKQEIITLAEKTYGLITSSTDVSEALPNLMKNYASTYYQLLGVDYEITFTSNNERDGKPHTLKLMVDKVQQLQLSFETPKPTFGMWLKKFWWLALLIVLILSGGVVMSVYMIKRRKAEREESAENLKNQMRLEYEESERRHIEEMEHLRNEQRGKEREAKEIERREKDAANQERLTKIMHSKNLLPRLKCKCGKDSFSYTITKPRVTFGRDDENDVVFKSQTVSGLHAEIVFNGSGFEVCNKSYSYSQGIVVNGHFYQKYTLTNGDMIGLGEAIVTFYV